MKESNTISANVPGWNIADIIYAMDTDDPAATLNSFLGNLSLSSAYKKAIVEAVLPGSNITFDSQEALASNKQAGFYLLFALTGVSLLIILGVIAATHFKLYKNKLNHRLSPQRFCLSYRRLSRQDRARQDHKENNLSV